jgi:acylglycerol lipase
VILVHGLQSHSQWFAECAESLFARGVAVYALDRRGSGSSPGVRGDIGRYTDWFEEVASVVRLARAEYPGAPAHLVGHCFGANLALGCALTLRPEIRSVTMLTPGLYILPDYALLAKLRILACGLLRPQTRFPVPYDDELFTRDPELLAWIRHDRLGARVLTARCLLQSGRMIRWLRRNIDRLQLPFLVLQAARDRISDNQRHRRLLDRRLGERCRLITFDAEHFLFMEPCRDAVVDTIFRWVVGDKLPAC